MTQFSILKPTNQTKFNHNIFGYDIETCDNNKKFLCASFWHEKPEFCRTFFNKDDVISYIKHKRFEKSFVSATNLSFDFFGTFHNKDVMHNFNTLFRGSHLLFAKTYLKYNEFQRKPHKNAGLLTFIDTGNYAMLSVDKLGKILKFPKLNKPEFLGKKPKNQIEWDELIRYNMRDSEISARALDFLFKSFHKLGASCRPTIASTSMSLFKNKYLKTDYFRHSVPDLDDEFKAYYGGRTEVFERGLFRDLNYYDVNSMHPYVMKEFKYPNPNSIRKTTFNKLDYVYAYEGVSRVIISAPYSDYPLLPYRCDDKLLFPTGTFEGWYTHIELIRALDLGYTIKKVIKTIYFKETCRPFEDFVSDLYKLRQDYKSKDNSMELAVKLLLNSLYGKFAQGYRNKDNWIPYPDDLSELDKYDFIERKGNYIRVKKEFTEPSAFCIPVWAGYITAYARIHLHNLITRSRAVYCDTDSIVTRKSCVESASLGGLKLEHKFKQAVFIKPKMYAFKTSTADCVKIKGLGVRLNFDQFVNEFIKDKQWTYNKFLKFKEAIRRDLTPNEIVSIVKEFGLEDNKRVWGSAFDSSTFQTSTPIEIGSETREKTDNLSLIEIRIKQQYDKAH